MTSKKTASHPRSERWSEADARGVLEAQAESGLSMNQFARDHGLSAQRLYWWKRRLEESRPTKEELDDLSFASVVLTSSSPSAAMVLRVGDIEVEVASPGKVDPAWLGSVVSYLRRG